ncbi:discoidin domain-containing protein [Danxiaibacter flavus]|uniref:Discoidin domain-containing protein n=1 Tax=Danxiaibacter flavus TaxID=3049108 RepID=A0ABV3ZM87_9BACT|nr:discoidin domain-containing protein [Chitinophagaceae bacterium DXS]
MTSFYGKEKQKLFSKMILIKKREVLLIFSALFFILILIYLVSTNKESFHDEKLNFVLKKAGKNRSQLEQVLSHYNKLEDSLKLRAAIFLIKNMDGKYSEDDRAGGEYFELFKNWNNLLAIGIADKKQKFDSLVNLYNLTNPQKHLEDLKCIKANFLINNIDRAFEVKDLPWNKNLPFDIFCEEILPYRLDTEPLEYWRDSILSEYGKIIDSIKEIPNIDAVEACIIVNTKLIKEWESSFSITTLPSMNYSMLRAALTGTCKQRTALGIFTMRGLGIPVVQDFTLQWPNRSMGHEWNAVRDTNGRYIPFIATESNPREPHKPEQIMAKAYRRTFEIQPELLELTKLSENIPSIFENKCWIDVTSEYIKGIDLKIELKNTPTNLSLAYLCVFDNQKWTPIQFANIENNSVFFKNVGKGAVYLPAFFYNNKYYPANYPLLLSSDGRLSFLSPDMHSRKLVKLFRKHPLLMDAKYTKRMKGGRFEGANRSDFSDAELLHTILTHPPLYYQDIPVNFPKFFRYVRYLSPDSSRCNIAELEFWGQSGKELELMKGCIIGTPGSYLNDPSCTIDKAFDGNVLSFVDANQRNGAWVGLDLGKPRKINRIRYLPRNDDNTIAIGQLYEFFYWDFDGWVSLGKQIATKQVLEYRNVPCNSLLLLKNLSKGMEERIFTYKNGKQIWW